MDPIWFFFILFQSHSINSFTIFYRCRELWHFNVVSDRTWLTCFLRFNVWMGFGFVRRRWRFENGLGYIGLSEMFCIHFAPIDWRLKREVYWNGIWGESFDKSWSFHEKIYIDLGVLQGSVLRPILFILFRKIL